MTFTPEPTPNGKTTLPDGISFVELQGRRVFQDFKSGDLYFTLRRDDGKEVTTTLSGAYLRLKDPRDIAALIQDEINKALKDLVPEPQPLAILADEWVGAA